MLDDVTEICRLCPTKSDLLPAFDFDKSVVDVNIRDAVFETTGIEIHKTDVVSQKICAQCYNIMFKLIKFRRSAVEHDKFLKEKCGELLKEQQYSNNLYTDVIKQTDKVPSRKRRLSSSVKIVERTSDPKRKKEIRMHQSVAKFFSLYPNLTLPSNVLNYDIMPYVDLNLHEVDNYFKAIKLRKAVVTKKVIKSAGTPKLTRSRASQMKKHHVPPAEQLINTEAEASKQLDNLKLNLGDVNENLNKPTYTRTPLKTTVHKNTKTQTIAKKKIDPTESLNQKTDDDIINRNRSPTTNKQDQISAHKNNETTIVAQQKEPNTPCVETPNPALEKHAKNIKSPSSKWNSDCFNTSINTISLVNKSERLFSCKICSAIEYSAKGLKLHTKRHLICQFCKRRFKSLERKTTHVDKLCEIKNMMSGTNVVVSLQKVDFDLDLRKKYPQVFRNFPKMSEISEDTNFNNSEDVKHFTANLHVIEPLSDEKDIAFILPIVPECIIKNRDNALLDRVENVEDDIKVIKTLIGLVNRPLKQSVAQGTLLTDITLEQSVTEGTLQTDNSDKSNKNGTCTFGDLVPQLRIHNIPVFCKNGPFHVTYNDYINDEPDKKKVASFSDIPLVNKTNINNQVVSRNRTKFKTAINIKKVTTINKKISVSNTANILISASKNDTCVQLSTNVQNRSLQNQATPRFYDVSDPNNIGNNVEPLTKKPTIVFSNRAATAPSSTKTSAVDKATKKMPMLLPQLNSNSSTKRQINVDPAGTSTNTSVVDKATKKMPLLIPQLNSNLSAKRQVNGYPAGIENAQSIPPNTAQPRPINIRVKDIWELQ